MTILEIIAAVGWLLASAAATMLWRVSRSLRQSALDNAALCKERHDLYDQLRELR
jgi:hypothetical protein